MTASAQAPAVERFLRRLAQDDEYGPQVAHLESIPSAEPVFAAPEPPLPEPLRAALADKGIDSLYSHQVRMIDLVRSGQDAVAATPTASGKSLTYWLPVIERLIARPDSRALFIFPLKALEQDQLRGLTDLADRVAAHGGPRLRAAIYDGDTPRAQRSKIMADPPEVIITNPDMLHLGFLAYHDKWAHLFSRLGYVVLDEAHTYRGVFGAHLAQLIRRLKRIGDYYGSRPQFVLSSATIDNPAGLAEKIIGRPVEAVKESGAPTPARHFLFLNPELSAAHTAARLLTRAIRAGLKTIVFTQSRKTTELIHMWTQSMLPGAKVSAYRAGFLPQDRRRIEADLTSGRLEAVISTSALELGIDIGALDLCLLVGYPGTVVTTWQRAGRVGRSERPSGVVLIAQPDALDQYIVRHPDDFFNRGYEPAVVDPDNPEIVAPHLVCAAAEIPLGGDDDRFGLAERPELLQGLTDSRRLVEAVQGNLFVAAGSRPHRDVSIRGVGEQYAVMHHGSRRALGTLDAVRAFKEAHPGAVYLHLGRQYVVDELDRAAKNILVHRDKVDYYTRYKSEKETEIIEVLDSRPTQCYVVRLGRLKVTERVIGYEKRRIKGQELVSYHELDLPPTVFETVGLWVEMEPGIQKLVTSEAGHFMGGIHAMEHAAIAMFPLLALCDRNDIGGISYPLHPQLGRPAVFIYDGYPGGVGLAATGYQKIEALLGQARRVVAECDCEAGCPSCIHSPKCGAGNKPLDKQACLTILEALTGRRQWEAAEVEVAPPPIDLDPPEEEEEMTLERPYGVFDLETQKLSNEVGGWGNIRLMGLAVGVLYHGPQDDYLTFEEGQVGQLIDRLAELPLVVGFNIIGFDYRVLSAYTDFDFSRLPTIDMLADIYKNYGFRIKLDTLVKLTLGQGKSADGLQAVDWYRQGRLDLVADYCRKDVELTKALFEFGLEHGYVVGERSGVEVKLTVDWAAQLADKAAGR